MEYLLTKDSLDFQRRQIKGHQTISYSCVWFSIIDRSIFTFFNKESIECIIYIKTCKKFRKRQEYK